MTLVAPTPRRKMSRARAARVFLKADGMCGICTRKIAHGEAWEVEHRIPLALGGSDEDENLYPAHYHCHKRKTAADAGDKAKRDRLVTKGWKGRSKSRGFQEWRKFNGDVVRRDER